MVSIFFFPSRLDPVLDGGPWDEDPVVTPQVPFCGLVRQAVLGNESDGQVLDTACVQALGPSQVGEVGGEVAVAVGAVMPGEGDGQIDGAADSWVAEVVQGARSGGAASGTATTARAAAGLVVAAARFDPGLGEILDAGDPLSRVGDIFAGSVHGYALHSQLPSYLHFTATRPSFRSLVMLNCPELCVFVQFTDCRGSAEVYLEIVEAESGRR